MPNKKLRGLMPGAPSGGAGTGVKPTMKSKRKKMKKAKMKY